jgi:hypothetical protein
MMQIDVITEKNLSVINESNDKDWEKYVSSHPKALFYHHPVWLRALEAETGNEIIRLAAKDSSGKLRGILPLQATAGMYLGLGGQAGAPRISSLPRTPLAGILADDEVAAQLLLDKAIKLTRENTGVFLQIKTTDSEYYKDSRIKIVPWRINYNISLPENEDDLRFGNPRNHRRIKWAVNKAAAEGVNIRRADSISDFKKWYTLYLETSRWHAVPPRSYKFFSELFNAPQEYVSLQIAEKKGQILAGSIFLKYNDTVFYSFNGRDQDQLNLRPNDLIQFHTIYQACREGYKFYDMGEVAGGQAGLVDFKKKWGCESKQIYHIYYHPSGKIKDELMSDTPGSLRLNIWRKIPIGITEKLGIIINKRL